MRRVVSTGGPIWIGVLLCTLLLAASAEGFAGDHQAEPDFDVRDGAATRSLPAGTNRLRRELGSLGTVAAGERGGVDFVGRSDAYLTGPGGGSAASIALRWISDNSRGLGLGADGPGTLELTDSYSSLKGVQHLRFEQIIGGLPAWGPPIKANLTAEGELINVSGVPAGGVELLERPTRLDRRDALKAARRSLDADPGPGFGEMESARAVAFSFPDGTARRAWAVHVVGGDGYLYEVVIDAANGDQLARLSKTDFLNEAAVYSPYPDINGTPQTVDLGADPEWLDDSNGGTRLAGNFARVRIEGADLPAMSGDWLYPYTFFEDPFCPSYGCTWDPGVSASIPALAKASAPGLLHNINALHDHFLEEPIGFDEASGNFERINSTGQGLDGDRVNAEQSTQALNNASFSTPPDGSSPLMSTYYFFTHYLNGADSPDLVAHEYTHGLTNRLIGSISGKQPESLGEGWSDWYALDWVVGSGVISDGPGEDLVIGDYLAEGTNSEGIRFQRMDCKPASVAPSCPSIGTAGGGGFTFGDLGKVNGDSVHANGEIWAQILWDLRDRLGTEDARAVITGGLRLSPANPTYLQARDAILQSALTLGMPRFDLWDVFAARGMGFSATSPGPESLDAVEAFDLPPGLYPGFISITDDAPLGDGDGIPETGETLQVTASAEKFAGPGLTEVSGSLTASPDIYVGTAESSWPDFPTGAALLDADGPFTASIGSECGTPLSLNLAVTSSAGGFDLDLPLGLTGTPTFAKAEPGIAIPDNDPGGVDVTLQLPAREIVDMDLVISELRHPRVGQLRLELTSPAGTSIVLADSPGSGADGAVGDDFVDLVFDDEAELPIEGIGFANPYTGSFQPDQPLSTFDGENAEGTWTLNVSDNLAANTGTLFEWGMTSGYECDTSVPPLPEIGPGETRDVRENSATIVAPVDDKGAATSVVFEQGKEGEPATQTETVAVEDGEASIALDGLESGADYEFRAIALRDGTAVAMGPIAAFSTVSAACGEARDALDEAKEALAGAESGIAAKSDKVKDLKRKLRKAEKKLKRAKKKLKAARKAGSKSKIGKAKKKKRRAAKREKRAAKKLKRAKQQLESQRTAASEAGAAAEAAEQAVAAACP